MPELCDTIVALKRQMNREKAQELLERVHKFALPLMRKYKLKIKTLAEFFPQNPNLLGINVNHGQKIAIRLRHASNPDSFLSFTDLLGTMLHELTHNKHGPHNEQFFAYLDRLKGEMQTLLNNGFKGDMWIGNGTRLGGLARPAGLPARAALRAGGIGWGRRLGGKSSRADLDTSTRRQKILDAAERRRQVDRACPAGEPLTGIEIIDMTRDESPQSSPQPSSAPDSTGSNNSPQSPPRQQTLFIDLT